MKIYIAFYHGGGSFVDRFIQKWTYWKQEFSKSFREGIKSFSSNEWKNVPSHVELSYDTLRWYSSSTRTGTFRGKLISLDEKKWRMYKFEVDPIEFGNMMTYSHKLLGTKYDWLNIFGSDGFNLDIGSKNRLTCDESVARTLRLCWVGNGLKEINNLNPHSLEIFIKEI